MKLADRRAKVDAKLAEWTMGTVVASKVDETYPERTVVYKYQGLYTVLRGFMFTGEAQVSVDKQDIEADALIKFLMEGATDDE